MTRGQARERRRSAWDWFLIAWGAAIIPNALMAFGVGMDGGWQVLQVVLSVAFVAAFVMLVVAFVRERLASPEPGP